MVNNLDKISQQLNMISTHIVKEHLNGKIPLFVIGSGISTDLKSPAGIKSNEKLGIPAMDKMIEKLSSLYEESNKDKIPLRDGEDLEKRFKIWKLEQGKKVDRGNVAGILGYFQEKAFLKDLWIKFNNWLLHECVNKDQKIGIIKANPSQAHEKIAELYEKVNLFCLTSNFDGLLLKALRSKYDWKAQSYYEKDKVERFFVREHDGDRYYPEIQIRGDIFYVMCDPQWCTDYNACGDRSPEPTRIWESNLLCTQGRYKKPFISFPGTYEKDKKVREILAVLWQYLAYRVSCVITIGVGGLWDPILVAFLSDLVNERELRFLDVNTAESSYIREEIIGQDTSTKRFPVNMTANEFMDLLSKLIDQSIADIQKRPKIEVVYSRNALGDDKFWDNILKRWEISDFEKKLMTHPSVEITSRFAQLGLKSKWWGISDEDRWQHNRLNHSKGVMKIASFLYEKACQNKNSYHSERPGEKQFLRIAALLHDIGHLPFSHLIEEVFQELNWKPGGYTETFSHDYYTAEKVRKLFEDHGLRDELDRIGYDVEDLIRLIKGEFGIGFLDAIIDGPIDADKIDYVLRDVESTKNVITRLDANELIENIGHQISISPAGFLVIKGNSAEAAFKVLNQRERLYKEFYLSKPIRLLEKAVKFIIITYFVHTFNTVEINTLQITENIKNRIMDDNNNFSDLGAIRIAMASEELERLSEKYKGESDIEMRIVEHMKDVLDHKLINISIENALNECFLLVKNTTVKRKCEDEASIRNRILDNSQFYRERIEKYRYDAKTTILRFPGAVLIDILPPFEFFKIAGGRKQRPRSDGTNQESEYILWPDPPQSLKEIQDKMKKEQGQVNAYSIGEESEVTRAMGLMERLIGEEQRLGEVE